MKNIFNKTNAPYLVSGALAIGTLLASGIFAVAPYIGFLAPVAALSLGLPFVIGGAVFSAAAIALSAVVIQKNGNIRRQSTLLHEEAKKLADNEVQLIEKNKKLKDKDTVISYLDAQSVKKDAEMQEQLDKKVKYIINSDEDAGRIHQERKERNREEVLDPVAFSNLFDENPSPENQPTRNGQSWTEWGINNAKTAAQLAMKGAMFAAFAAPYIYTFFERPEISPASQMLFQSGVGNQSTDSVPSFILEKSSWAVPFGMRTASY